MVRSVRSLVIALASAALFLAVPAGSEQDWDQEAVTKLAAQLVETAGDLRTSVRQAPPPSAGRGAQRRAHFEALDDLRVVQGSINSLHSQLEAGGDRQSTYPTYRRIGLLRRDIARNARRSMLTEPTLSKLQQARDILTQMAPFYAAEVAADEEIEAG